MIFKLDENFGIRAQSVFEDAGYEVHTVRQESLQGAPDRTIYDTICEEQYCLITFDLDFSDVIRFPPEKTGGIVVIRLPRNPSLELLEVMISQFLQAVSIAANDYMLQGRLWIVEVGRIRMHQSESMNDI